MLLAAILPGFCVYLVLSCSAPTQARDEQARQANASGGTSDRIREGTTVDVQGTFKLTGDRIMFYSSPDNRRFGTLENLNLERVARVVSETPETLEWTVSGTVSEFQGANYLLVSRAVLKNKPRHDAAKPRGSAAVEASKP